jgi:site-specific recombinase XerD
MAITYKIELNSKPKIDSTHGIMLRVTENRKMKRISTGIFINPKDFNPKADYGKWIRRSNPKHAKYNEDLETFISKAKEAKTNIEVSKKQITANSIISELKNTNTDSFIVFYEEELKKVYYTNSYNFYKNSLSKLENLRKYLKGKDLLFTDIDLSFLKEYETAMRKEGKATNTIYTNLKTIRIFFYRALKEKKLNIYNPFKDYELKEEAGKKERLTVKQIKAIEALELEENSTLWHVRNYFLFSFYCAGIRVGDFIQLKWENIQGDSIVYTMGKNGKARSLSLIPKAKAILNNYKPKKTLKTYYIFPLLDNERIYTDPKLLNSQIGSKTAIININLKKLAEKAEIDSNLTFHISRHSYADIVRKSKASLYDLSKLLGHSSIKITEVYIAGFDTEATNTTHEKAMNF